MYSYLVYTHIDRYPFHFTSFISNPQLRLIFWFPPKHTLYIISRKEETCPILVLMSSTYLIKGIFLFRRLWFQCNSLLSKIISTFTFYELNSKAILYLINSKSKFYFPTTCRNVTVGVLSGCTDFKIAASCFALIRLTTFRAHRTPTSFFK